MLTNYLMWRVMKWVGLALFSWGIFSSGTIVNAKQRLAAVYGPATLGGILLWLSGYMMAKHMEISMGEPWISSVLLLSGLSVIGALFTGVSGSVLWRSLSWAAFGACLGAMVGHELGPLTVVSAAILGVLGYFWPTPALETHGDPHKATDSWFRWLGRFEATSVIILFGVFLPLKFGAHIEIDRGTGFVGWFHGVLLISYLGATFRLAHMTSWPWTRVIQAVVLAVIPLGPLWLERQVPEPQ